ncbi:MAG: ABC transporter permease [Lachnospiraceae bacterium]|nr:ABC transporter permease [Lachnospiraceae bacterium]
MLKVMFQKLRANKWMTLCLLVGIVLLIASVASFPMYKTAALNRMLQDEFRKELAESGKWPASARFNVVAGQKDGIESVLEAEKTAENLFAEMGVTEKELVKFYNLGSTGVTSTLGRIEINDLGVRVGFYSNLENHIKVLSGEGFSEDGYTDEGEIEALINEDTMVDCKFIVGEVLTTRLKTAEGKNYRIKIVGVYTPADSNDYFWQMVPQNSKSQLLIKEELFKDAFMENSVSAYAITAIYNLMFDYSRLDAKCVDKLYEKTVYMMNESKYAQSFQTPTYLSILDSFNAKKTRTEATLFMLMIPVLFLVGAFIFMVAGQLYEMESNEISVMKSRGSSTGQIFRMYLYQNVFLCAVGAAAGLPLGKIFAEILGATRSFMEFSTSRRLVVRYTDDVLIYAGAAALFCIIILTLPAIKHSRVSIVKLKQKKAERRHSWWEKCFLDIILLALSIYGYYIATKSDTGLAEDVLRGQSMDPIVYISSSLMLVGMGLLFIRLQPLLISLIYLIGKRFWRPASYISFMENKKNGRKEQFIILFMILSISLGMLHSGIARTILANAEADAEYLAGADLICKEVWKNNAYAVEDSGEEFRLFEPDFGRFAELKSVENCTKVIYDDKASVMGDKGKNINVTLLGINTKEFGNTTDLVGLTEKDFREYLNELAVSERGAIVSSSFRDERGMSIGDNITFQNSEGKTMYCQILDFFDYWPGFTPTVSYSDEVGNLYTESQYMSVTHFGLLNRQWGLIQYEVWMKLREGFDSSEFYAWVKDNNIQLLKFTDRNAMLEAVSKDPLLQGTNGILTMGYLITMLLCGAGYLIYWIMFIRSREMVFGILRAGGMHKSEVFHLLINEQIFAGGFAIASGIIIGKITSDLFVPVLQAAYSASNQVLPMKLISGGDDLLKLYGVIIGVVVVCLLVLMLIVRHMNVAKALKLGEE